MGLGLLDKCRPDLIVPRLEEVHLEALRQEGIRGLILDLDNTLCAWRSSEISRERREWLEQAKQHFRLCILSNTVKFRRLRWISETAGVPAIASWGIGRKPFRGGFRAALRILGTKPEETAMIGDQLFADILGAKRMGMKAIWLPPLERQEFITTRLARCLERWTLRRLGIVPPGEAGNKARSELRREKK